MFQKRQENTYAPFSKRDVGVRFVLASPNAQGVERIKALESQAHAFENVKKPRKESGETPEVVAKTGEEQLIRINLDGDPEAELEKIYAVTQSPLIKSNLMQFKELIRGQNEALSKERDANLLSLIRAGAYKADNMTNIAFRCFQLDHEMKSTKEIIKGNLPPDVEKKMNGRMQRHFRNLQVSTNLYRNSVEEAAQYPKEVIDAKLYRLRQKYGSDDQLNRQFRENLDKFAGHVEFARQNGINKLNDRMIWKNVLPHDKMYEVVVALDNPGKGGKKKK